MRKFVVVALMLCCLGVFVGGCGKSALAFAKENMSEKTEIYFFGETEEFYATLSCGEREDPYLVNGKSEKCVKFGLLTINFFGERVGNVVAVKFFVDDVMQTLEAELNQFNNTYMIDLGKTFSGDEEIFVEYDDEKFQLENLSKDFRVGADKVIEIASKELSAKILKERKHSSLNAECYLRVLDKHANNFQDVFWVFTVVNIKNESFSIVISSVDGSVLSKSK